MGTLLTINTTVPEAGSYGVPEIVFFDNGDWDIVFSGDVPVIEDNSAYVGSLNSIEFMNELRLINDYNACDEVDRGVLLFIEVTIDEGTFEEPVLGIYTEGDSFITERFHAERLLEEDGMFFNFIPVVEIMDDLRKFISRNLDTMFPVDEIDDDAEKEEGL